MTMLDGKIVLITGSSRGIGAATARLAKSYGATVILHGRTDSAHLKKIGDELGSECYICDVTDKDGVKKLVDNVINKFGKIDVLINCAGTAQRATFMEADDLLWLELFKVNVLGTVHFCQAAIPHMLKAKYGRIVNVASIRGYCTTSGRPAYSVTKAGIINLTASLAKEFAPSITINAIAPGFTETDMAKSWDDAVWKQANSALLGRAAQPQEIAEALLFLASDRASFITGQTLLLTFA